MIKFSYHVCDGRLSESIASENSEVVIVEFIECLLRKLSHDMKKQVFEKLKRNINNPPNGVPILNAGRV